MRAAAHLAVLLSLYTSACADRQARGSVSTTIDTVNGAQRVRNTGAAPRWELQEIVTLGTGADVDDAGPQSFARISGVVSDAEHNIYVAEASAADIRVFDERGALLRTFGRKGAGPGEFTILQSIGWLGDTLAVMDAGNARIGLLSQNGDWLGQRPFGRITGDVRFQQTGPDELYSMAIRRVENRGERALVRQTSAGEGDTLAAQVRNSSPQRVVICSYKATGGNALSFFSASFDPQNQKLAAPGLQLVEYYNAEYRLHFLTPAADTVRTVERDLPRLPISDGEWNAEEAKFREWYDQLPPDRTCQPGGLQRPEAKSMLLGIFFDDLSRTWVERRTGTGRAFDVFDRDGRLLAELDAPERVKDVPPYIRGDRLYLVTADSLDVQYVKAFRIRPAR